MKRILVVPLMLMAAAAFAETPAPPPGADGPGPGTPPAAGMPCGPDGGGPMMHGRDGKEWRHHHDILGNLPKPLTPDAVKKAFDEEMAQRPHVGQVVEKDANTLVVDMVGPDGKLIRQIEIDRNTGAHRPPAR